MDDELEVLGTIRQWLDDERISATCVRTAADALRLARQERFTLALVDFHLQVGHDGVWLGQELLRSCHLPFILISGYLDTPAVVAAMRAGACDVLDKPLTAHQMIAAIDGALLGSVPLPSCSREDERASTDFRAPHQRWARLVLEACGAGDDPRTMRLWAHHIGTSEGVIREACRRCGVRPHDARDLARFLRAISRNRHSMEPLRRHFDIADERTLKRLFVRSGVSQAASDVALRTFIVGQAFVAIDRLCVRELGHLSANSAFFT